MVTPVTSLTPSNPAMYTHAHSVMYTHAHQTHERLTLNVTHRDGPLDLCQVLSSVVLHQAADQGALPTLRLAGDQGSDWSW